MNTSIPAAFSPRLDEFSLDNTASDMREAFPEELREHTYGVALFMHGNPGNERTVS